MGKKTDGRKLDAATQAHVRRLVITAVRGGMKQMKPAETYGISLRAVNKWVALNRAGGLRALKPKRRGRKTSEGRLSGGQATRIRQLIIGKMPDQLKLPLYLWTRAAVPSLIAREYGVTVSLTTVRRERTALREQ